MRRRTKGMSGHQRPNRGATDSWLTPPKIVAALGRFDLDPCGAPTPRPYTLAERTVSLPTDGFDIAWRGRVWLNPPYSEVGRWVGRLADHGWGTALVFARTETRWFQAHVLGRAEAVLFLAGRLHFHRPDGIRAVFNAGAPSCLAAYGKSDADALASSRLPGVLLMPALKEAPK